MIYTSLNKNVSWYDNSGLQFIGIAIISAPILLAIGLILVFLSKKYKMSKQNLMIPFYALAGILLPILIDGSLSKITLIIGGSLCVVFIIKTILVIIYEFKNFNNKKIPLL